MKKYLKTVLPLALAAALILSMGGCTKRSDSKPRGTEGPAMSPSARATEEAAATASAQASAEPSAQASAEPSAEASPLPSADPSGSPETLFPTGDIEGFMEGEVVDPEAVPDLVRLLEARFPGMKLQSVTYKLFEERQAYYVVLQGEGEASHPVYVFADGTVRDEGM